MPPGGMNLCPVYIHGGQLRASMPEQCEVVYAVVYNPALRSEEVMRQIRAAVDGVVASDSWLREQPARSTRSRSSTRCWSRSNFRSTTRPCAALADGLSATHWEREPEYGSLPGPCDANIMSEAGVTTVIFGPGDLAMNAHGTNEYVPVQQVIDACKVYASLMIDCCAEFAPNTAFSL